MSRRLKIGGLALLAILLILQFFQPEQNNAPVDAELDMLAVLAPPEHIWALSRNACYDCHSNQTIYPWYEKVSPVSWYLHKHIQDGKEDLNFSDYGKMDKVDRIGALVDFCNVLDAGTMPLQSYLLLHKNARLSQEEKETLCNWTEDEALKVIRE